MPPRSSPTQLPNEKDLAERYRVSDRTIKDWVARGDLRCVRLGRRIVRFRWEDIEEFERAHLTEGPAAA